jgi:DNA topoisomerase IA
MRLWIVEKYSSGKSFRAANLITPDDIVLYTIGFGHWRFQLPDVSFSDIPYAEMPTKKVPLFNHCHGQYLEMGDCSSLVFENKYSPQTREYKSLILTQMMDIVKKQLTDCTEIIVAVDADRSGMWGAGQIIDQIPLGKIPAIHCMKIASFGQRTLQHAYDTRHKHPWYPMGFGRELQGEQRIKKYFEHWWYANGRLVFGELSNKTGLSQGRLLSKYSVMLLLILHKSDKKHTEASLIRLMQDWRGTGKYKNKHISMGSNASRATIVKNLYSCGALESTERCVKMTEAGKAFVDRLHPRTFDADLPFRLEQWCQSGDLAAVQEYIKTLFGRQLSYQRHTG